MTNALTNYLRTKFKRMKSSSGNIVPQSQLNRGQCQ